VATAAAAPSSRWRRRDGRRVGCAPSTVFANASSFVIASFVNFTASSRLCSIQKFSSATAWLMIAS
jgi:hypothetical protein